MFHLNPSPLQPVSTSLCSDSGDVQIRSTGVQLRVQRHEPPPLQNTDLSAAQRPSRALPPPGEEELRTIRLTSGGRGAGLEALRQRSQSAPRRREVRVTLLDSTDSPKQNSNSHNASEAPQLDVQRVAELTESVQRLLQTHRGQSLTEETLQRLETLHNQQLTLQNQLLDSALKMVMRPAPQAPPPSHLSSEPEPSQPVKTLPVPEAPPCCCDPPTHSLTPASEPTSSPSRENKPKPSRALQNRTRTPRTQLQSNRGSHGRPQQKRTQSKPPQIQTHETEGHQNYIRYLQQRIHSHHSDLKTHRNQVQMQPESKNTPLSEYNSIESQTETETVKNGPQIHQNQIELQQREPADQENYNQYSQNRTKTHQIDKKKQNGTQSSQNLSEEQKNQTQGVVTGLKREEIQRNWAHGEEREAQNGGKCVRDEQKAQNGFSGLVPCSSGSVGQRSAGQDSQGGQRSASWERQWSQRSSGQMVLDEAGMVLRRVQRQRKLLEENLESQLRARTGDLLHCHLNALYQNRDCSEELRIKKTVDSWIRDIQVEIEKTSGKQVSAGSKAPTSKTTAERKSSAPSGRARPLSTLRTTSSRPTRTSARVKPPDGPPVDPELHLRRLYGNAPHDGQRRSLKRSPYLRLTSPVSPVSPDRSKPRPRIVETVRGVKLKSQKTQTTSDPEPVPGPDPDLGPSPVLVHSQSGPSFPPTAIPLGRPRIDSSHRVPPVVTTSPAQEVTSQPGPSPAREVTSPPKSPSQQEITSQSKDVKKQVDPPPTISEAADPPELHILQSSPQEQEQEEEFPGTHFLSVADLEQSDGGSEKELLQIEGGPDPDPLQNQGPVFPPQPPAPALPSAQQQTPHLGYSIHQDALENRLVQWVEQQLMARMISEMYRPLVSDPVQNQSLVQSDLGPDPSQNLAHGDSGLQLLVDPGLDLDQNLVRDLVHEVLTETVALFLGSRESQEPQTGSEPGLGLGGESAGGPVELTDSKTTEVSLQVLVQTPGPSPVHSPTPPPEQQTPPLSPVTTPAVTPLPLDLPSLKEDPPPGHVATPPPSPVTCLDPELPLVEDSPEKQEKTADEPIVVPAPVPSPDPGPRSEPPSPPDASSSSPSSPSSPSSSPSTAHTAPKHISEGELLLSLNQLQALQDGCSFSSSLHELQEMELDPPSEGQVRSLCELLKIQQREPRPQPEGARGRGLEQEEEVSVGEIRDMRPPRNLNASPGQTSLIQGDVFEWTNQSELSSDLHMDLSLDSHLTQTEAVVHKEGLDPGSDLDYEDQQDQHNQQNLQHQQSPERNGDGVNSEGGGAGGLMKRQMQVFVPSVKTVEEETSETDSSDIF